MTLCRLNVVSTYFWCVCAGRYDVREIDTVRKDLPPGQSGAGNNRAKGHHRRREAHRGSHIMDVVKFERFADFFLTVSLSPHYINKFLMKFLKNCNFWVKFATNNLPPTHPSTEIEWVWGGKLFLTEGVGRVKYIPRQSILVGWVFKTHTHTHTHSIFWLQHRLFSTKNWTLFSYIPKKSWDANLHVCVSCVSDSTVGGGVCMYLITEVCNDHD